MATHCYTDKKHIGNGYNIFVPEIQQVTGHDQLFVTALFWGFNKELLLFKVPITLPISNK